MNEYANPYEFAEQSSGATGMPRMKPSGITPIGVIAIILCALGALGGLMQLAAPLMGSFMKGIQQDVIDQAAENPGDPAMQMQSEIQKQSMVVQEKYSTANLAIGGIMAVACLAVVVSAGMTMNGSSAGRGFFAIMCLVILFCDLGKSAVTAMQQREAIGGMDASIQKFINAEVERDDENAEAAEGVAQFAGWMMKAASIFALVWTIGWFLLKAFFWIYSWRYLNRPEVKDFYDDSPVMAEAT